MNLSHTLKIPLQNHLKNNRCNKDSIFFDKLGIKTNSKESQKEIASTDSCGVISDVIHIIKRSVTVAPSSIIHQPHVYSCLLKIS